MSKCLLFDCDGTLVDSEVLNCEAMSAELQHSGINEHPAHLFERYKGAQFAAVLNDLQQLHSVALDDGFAERFRERAHHHFTQHLQPVAGIRQALESLQHPACVVSNAPLKKIQHELEITRLLHFFSGHLYSAYDVGHWKPAPDLLLQAAAKEGYQPQDCVVIEDSPVGVRAAQNAGMPVVLYDAAGSSAGLDADIVIHCMSELPNAIAGL